MEIIKKYLSIIIGSISLALGIIGVFLPLLPTTPFLLLAVYCYFRGSYKLHQRLIKNKILGVYIYNYITYRAVSRSTKIYTVIVLWLSLFASMIIIKNWWIAAILFLVGIGVSIHVLTLKTIKKNEKTQPECKTKYNWNRDTDRRITKDTG